MLDFPSRISNNMVMVKPVAHMNTIGEWQIFDIHDTSHHMSVKGEVLMVPDELYCHGDLVRKLDAYPKCSQVTKTSQFYACRSLEYGNKMDLQVGDEVVFRYINHVECIADGRFWHVDNSGIPALFMSYDTLFMAQRGDEQIMLNGWLWVEPTLWSKEEVMNDAGMVVATQGKKKVGSGCVRNVGNPNSSYLYSKGSDLCDIKVGDDIMFQKTAGVSVEYFCHQSLNEGRHPYYIMQRKDILAVV